MTDPPRSTDRQTFVSQILVLDLELGPEIEDGPLEFKYKLMFILNLTYTLLMVYLSSRLPTIT